MGLVKGGFQRLLQTILYLIIFLCAGVILGIYSYFLSVLADHNTHIPVWEKAVEGISGAACLYTLFATILTCCLGGITVLAILAIILDLCFVAGMIAIMVLTRHGVSSCKGKSVNTPLGTGAPSSHSGFGGNGFGSGSDGNIVYSVSLGTACHFNTAAFAVAVIAAILFLCTAAMQLALMRKHKQEKRYGPSPDNNYTSGAGKKSKFAFGRKKGNNTKASEAGAFTSTTNGNRVSAETGYTGTTAGHGTTAGYDTYDQHNKVETGGHSGYYTAPTGTAASNPYGYNNNTATNY